MPRAIFVVYTQPIDAASDGEFNDWYDRVHLPDVCAVPGIMSGSRYRLSDVQFRDPRPERIAAGDAAGERGGYCGIYELDADDLQSVVTELQARIARGEVPSTPTLQTDPVPPATIYEWT